jgi:threonylcarbamoyladenosine tRNA methylthiotransferase MtaB
MTRFWVQNFGCRATLADAAEIEHHLSSKGYTRSESLEAADVVVLNTCTVTASADRQARQAIRETQRDNHGARIVVTGCYAQRAPGEIASLPGVTHVVGNAHQMDIAGLLAMDNGGAFLPVSHLQNGREFPAAGAAKILTSDVIAAMSPLPALPLQADEPPTAGRTRATLKIQDGCDHHCAYCIIPAVRGRSRSMGAEDVLEQVSSLAQGGYREIVLSGINLGSYGHDLSPRKNLPALLVRLLGETPVEQLRLSSIEPVDVTQELIDMFARTERLAPHFHMPLQSGSDPVLRAMHRWYTARQYARRVEYLHEAMPDAAIGADVIAGFPGETDSDHRATLAFISGLPFAYLHVFSYSARPGTEAASLPIQPPMEVVRERARELRALGERKRREFVLAQDGKEVRVLTLETARAEWREAISGNFQRVRVAGEWPRNIWLSAWPMADGSIAPARLYEGFARPVHAR